MILSMSGLQRWIMGEFLMGERKKDDADFLNLLDLYRAVALTPRADYMKPATVSQPSVPDEDKILSYPEQEIALEKSQVRALREALAKFAEQRGLTVADADWYFDLKGKLASALEAEEPKKLRKV